MKGLSAEPGERRARAVDLAVRSRRRAKSAEPTQRPHLDMSRWSTSRTAALRMPKRGALARRSPRRRARASRCSAQVERRVEPRSRRGGSSSPASTRSRSAAPGTAACAGARERSGDGHRRAADPALGASSQCAYRRRARRRSAAGSSRSRACGAPGSAGSRPASAPPADASRAGRLAEVDEAGGADALARCRRRARG